MPYASSSNAIFGYRKDVLGRDRRHQWTRFMEGSNFDGANFVMGI